MSKLEQILEITKFFEECLMFGHLQEIKFISNEYVAFLRGEHCFGDDNIVQIAPGWMHSKTLPCKTVVQAENFILIFTEPEDTVDTFSFKNMPKKIKQLSIYDVNFRNLIGDTEFIEYALFDHCEIKSFEGCPKIKKLEFRYCELNDLTGLRGNVQQIICSRGMYSVEEFEKLMNTPLPSYSRAGGVI